MSGPAPGPASAPARLKRSQLCVDPQGVPDPPPIERAFFREAEDGATVFFPWGFTHRGYRLPDDAAKSVEAATLAVGTFAAWRLEPLVAPGAEGLAHVLRVLALPGAALLLVILGYWAWVSRFVEGLPESDLQVSREERLREAAEVGGPGRIALLGASFLGLSAFLVWLEPRAWWLGALGMALGALTIVWGFVLHRASARTPAAGRSVTGDDRGR